MYMKQVFVSQAALVCMATCGRQTVHGANRHKYHTRFVGCPQESGWNVVNVAKVARELQKEYADAPYMHLPDLGTLTGDKRDMTQL